MSLADKMALAEMDPWCTVPLQSGTEVLFGYASVHPGTGGLSWMSSSEIMELDIPIGRARTRSGRIYKLGRQFALENLYYEGEEAVIAFELLLGDDVIDQANTATQVLDRLADSHWVAACKVARHIGIEPPKRILHDVDSFLSQHREAYLRIRASRR
ncbi:hypothetical protein JMJ56_22320 [Belnapia sp. T18]|uniref:Uncharacterized protein n=1 Tax=Belnapia arida TaxID=2804533 RepID=A0ABS1U9F9_9PROT|nr:hypothetical protein [Belnapia arida]MBL6080755.1 hypothetical protein [Belnapia arida]